MMGKIEFICLGIMVTVFIGSILVYCVYQIALESILVAILLSIIVLCTGVIALVNAIKKWNEMFK